MVFCSMSFGFCSVMMSVCAKTSAVIRSFQYFGLRFSSSTVSL